jgi:rare lipoprotein A
MIRAAGCTLVAMTVANCSAPQKLTAGGGIDPKYGVAASPRVVAEGEPVPKGGGHEMLGKPYLVAGRLYSPRVDPNYAAVGTASWYGSAFHGRLTANGEIFDRDSIAAAHPTLPLPSYVRVTNLRNSSSMVVRVNDRGPYHGNRVLDVSQRVAEALDFKQFGTARVRVEYLGRASIRGSDDGKLLATLRTDGDPATLPGGGAVLLASNEPERPQAPQTPRRSASSATASVAPADASAASYSTPSYVTATDSDAARAIFRAAAEAPEPRLQTASAASLAPLEPLPPAARPQVTEIVSGKRVTGIPLPPERPFNLGTQASINGPVAHAATPANRIANTFAEGAGRPTGAPSLFYTAEQAQVLRLGQADPLPGLVPQQYVLFQRVASN